MRKGHRTQIVTRHQIQFSQAIIPLFPINVIATLERHKVLSNNELKCTLVLDPVVVKAQQLFSWHGKKMIVFVIDIQIPVWLKKDVSICIKFVLIIHATIAK